MTEKQTMIGFLLSGVLLLVLFLCSFGLDGQARDVLLHEGGIIETASALGYLLCVVMIVYKGKFAYLKKYHYSVLLITFFMLRELDFHKRFTTMGMFKTKFFYYETVPLVEKVIGVLVILLLCYVVFMIIYRHAKGFFIGLKERSSMAFGALIVIGFLSASVVLDGIGKSLTNIGITLSQQMSLHAVALEEILEFGVPVILLLTLSAYFSKRDHAIV